MTEVQEMKEEAEQPLEQIMHEESGMFVVAIQNRRHQGTSGNIRGRECMAKRTFGGGVSVAWRKVCSELGRIQMSFRN
jgi:hypothetical protein